MRRIAQLFRQEIKLVSGDLIAPADRERQSSAVVVAVITAAVVAWGNGLVLLGRQMNPEAREFVTAIAHPSLGAIGCLALIQAGWRRTDLGLTLPRRAAIGSRVWSAVVILLLIAAGLTVIALAVDGIGKEGLDVRLALLRLAVGTALGEELLHRGVLLALWVSTRSSPRAVVLANAVAFGTWHLAGALPKDSIASVAGVVVPAMGTPVLVWARCRSQSIAGPALVHYVVNLSSLLIVGRD